MAITRWKHIILTSHFTEATVDGLFITLSTKNIKDNSGKFKTFRLKN